MTSFIRSSSLSLAVTGLCLILASCGSSPKVEYDYPSSSQSKTDPEMGSLFEGATTLFSSGGEKKSIATELPVNGYMWRAALETFSFLPMRSADPVAGVIISDWYSDPIKPDERFKVTVYIMDRDLRADALRVSAFRETRTNNNWSAADVAAQTNRRLEDAILVRARELRIADQAVNKD